MRLASKYRMVRGNFSSQREMRTSWVLLTQYPHRRSRVYMYIYMVGWALSRHGVMMFLEDAESSPKTNCESAGSLKLPDKLCC